MFDSFTLVAATADLADERAARGVADLVEFRMDLAADPVEQLAAYDGDLPLLVTNRPAWEGGETDGSSEAAETARLDALDAALGNDAVAAVDLELAALRRSERAVAVAEAAESLGVAVVVSVHDFERTPSERTMAALLSAAASAGDVGKLAVTATDREDALALLSATHAVDAAGEHVATMAMGEVGRHTRAVAPLYGSKIGYAPVHAEEATAPGQYDLETLAELVTRLRSR
ncbi:type I 3-dehydroquinate dehydratase [Halolamina sp. CBA1230]|uniref:type I 3-dehydroquinate dehydratase n=1 Tax=Halolamina sp. CBA1230 TaxID=1853690 RepID=UPI0009A1B5AB|nr:type I 3-dehydroquinate dehydratase [Halolamina sp. CBA1230]QKY20404.1 type I 3-dehydroquinate dehydratase [Halolamina sp. CBA1230]